MARTTIPKKLRKEMEIDPEYKVCMLYGHHGHICGGRITKEHTLIFAGKSYQARWSIISLCARGHAVDQYQDNHECNKELNLWIALNRALPEELQAISKAVDYSAMKTRLNGLYGVWSQNIVYQNFAKDKIAAEVYKNGFQTQYAKPKKDWFLVDEEAMKQIKDIQAYFKSQDDYHMPYPDVIRLGLKKLHEAMEELKNSITRD